MALSATERSRRRRALMTPAERTAEHARYAVRRRVALIRELAPDGVCAECRKKFDHDQLVVDHPRGRLWMVEEVSPSMRAARYWREHRAGVPMRALCGSCSSITGGGIRYHGERPTRRAAQRVAPRGST